VTYVYDIKDIRDISSVKWPLLFWTTVTNAVRCWSTSTRRQTAHGKTACTWDDAASGVHDEH